MYDMPLFKTLLQYKMCTAPNGSFEAEKTKQF